MVHTRSVAFRKDFVSVCFVSDVRGSAGKARGGSVASYAVTETSAIVSGCEMLLRSDSFSYGCTVNFRISPVYR